MTGSTSMPAAPNVELSTAEEFLDNAPFGMHVYSLTADDRLVFEGANATANRILGVDHQQFVGKTIEEAFPALAATEVPERYREVALSKQLWTTDQVDYDEHEIRGAFEVRAVPMGNRRMAAFFADITDRLRVEHALRSKQHELDTYFTHALDLLCIATTDGRFKRINPEWAQLLGVPLAELEGQRFLDYVHPDDLGATLQALEQLKNQSSVTNFVNRYRCRGGEYRSIEWRSFPVGDEIYAIARDITERIKTESQLKRALRDSSEKGQELESLLYVTTHDLRSPLVNIQGFSARIERALAELSRILRSESGAPPFSPESVAKVAERIGGSLDYIASSAQKMDRLITGLLQLSRLGRRPVQWTNVDMDALWRQVRALFQHQLREAHIEVQTGELPPCRGDQSQLDQVLSNLLDNAIKYRDPKRPCVISFSGRLDHSGTNLYRFGDTGRGIAAEHIDRIWELFHRLAPHEDLPGDGIGLTAARQIISRHGGEISVESKLGVGTTFLLQLPSTTD